MALLSILEFPDPRLRTRAEPVRAFDAALRKLIADMFQTMYAAPGIGLAATQVDVHRALLIMDASHDKNQPQVYINPEILLRDGVEVSEEGCPSRACSRKCNAPHACASGRRTPRARCSSANSRTSMRSACSTKWIIWPASCLSTTSQASSVSASGAGSRKSAESAPAAPLPRPRAPPRASYDACCVSHLPVRRSLRCRRCARWPHRPTSWLAY